MASMSQSRYSASLCSIYMVSQMDVVIRITYGVRVGTAAFGLSDWKGPRAETKWRVSGLYEYKGNV